MLAAEGVEDGELGLAFVGPDEMRALKRDHLGIDEATDVLSFPIDGREELAEGMPRALGDVVLCPQVVGEEWRTPLVHGLLHLLGYEHGDAMEEREAAHHEAADGRRRSSSRSTSPSRGSSTSSARSGTCASTSSSPRSSSSPRCVSDVDKLELIALLLAIAFVLIAEMLNTAVEAAVDVATTSFDPMAKLAKDIAAGAVLIATAVAVAVGYLVFSGQVADARAPKLLDRLTDASAELTLVALVLTTIVVIGTKALTGRGTPLRGGLPSGHAAVAFAGWMAATLILGDSQPSLPDLVADLHHGVARGPDTRRIRSALLGRGRSTAACSGRSSTLAVFQVAQ